MITAMSPTLATPRLQEVRSFYESHFGARTVFDCGWYLSLQLGAGEGTVLSLMQASPEAPSFSGGLTLNLQVPDADVTYTALVERGGLNPVMPLEDHPWGDRGFAVLDPIGTRLYCYHEIPVSPEYRNAVIAPQPPASGGD